MADNPPFDIAKAVLTAAKNAMSDPPERRYVTVGPPSQECDHLVVSVSQVRPEDRITDRECVLVPAVVLVVEAGRCVPGPDDNGNPPSAEALQDAAEITLRDAWELLAGLYDAMSDGTLFPEGCRLTAFEAGDLPPPSGNYGAARIRLRIAVG